MDNDDGDSANAYGDNEYGYPVYQDNDNGVMAMVMKDTMYVDIGNNDYND